MFSIAPSILSHIVWPQANFHVYKVYIGAKGNLASFLEREAYLDFYFGRVPNFLEILIIGQSIWCLLTLKINFVGSFPILISSPKEETKIYLFWECPNIH
jgi:hypothetical protein